MARWSREGTDARQCLAYNAGSDARLDLEPAEANPHRYGSFECYWWDRGWHDVHEHWGEDAKWPFKRLREPRWDTNWQ